MEGAGEFVRVHVRLNSGVERFMLPDDSLVIGQKITFTDTGHVRAVRKGEQVFGVAVQSIKVFPDWCVGILEEK